MARSRTSRAFLPGIDVQQRAHSWDIAMLKRRTSPGAQVAPEFLTWYLNGPLFASTSGVQRPHISGMVGRVLFSFVTTGSAACSVRLLKNGATVQTWSVPAGVTTFDRDAPTVAVQEITKLQIQVVSAGTGWASMTAQVEIRP